MMRSEPLPFATNDSGAWINPRGNRRYLLWRMTGAVPYPADDRLIAFIMLNPSDAGIHNDDPTLRRCRGFARDWEYTQLFIGNLYSIKGPKPDAIDFRNEPDLFSDHINVAVLEDLLVSTDLVVAAWGRQPHIGHQQEQFLELARNVRCDLYHLGLNDDGSPKHPLYLAKDTKLEKWVANC